MYHPPNPTHTMYIKTNYTNPSPQVISKRFFFLNQQEQLTKLLILRHLQQTSLKVCTSSASKQNPTKLTILSLSFWQANCQLQNPEGGNRPGSQGFKESTILVPLTIQNHSYVTSGLDLFPVVLDSTLPCFVNSQSGLLIMFLLTSNCFFQIKSGVPAN